LRLIGRRPRRISHSGHTSACLLWGGLPGRQRLLQRRFHVSDSWHLRARRSGGRRCGRSGGRGGGGLVFRCNSLLRLLLLGGRPQQRSLARSRALRPGERRRHRRRIALPRRLALTALLLLLLAA
jgi:hypothetical protein